MNAPYAAKRGGRCGTRGRACQRSVRSAWRDSYRLLTYRARMTCAWRSDLRLGSPDSCHWRTSALGRNRRSRTSAFVRRTYRFSCRASTQTGHPVAAIDGRKAVLGGPVVTIRFRSCQPDTAEHPFKIEPQLCSPAPRWRRSVAAAPFPRRCGHLQVVAASR